jgi:hypothetical protein
VKGLFDDFEGTGDRGEQMRIATEALVELDIHAGIEEEIFYPAFRAEVDEEESDEIILEAEEEHRVVHTLIGEIRDLLGTDDERFKAKFTVLMENVRHHIEEEEDEMLPKADQLGDDRLAELGSEMMARKEILQGEFEANFGQPGALRT